ncbi:MAG TPA: aminoglycoside phosphotransferase family protein, partial [Actinopolymorphaceae bacterium]|nr:aminoglycoside phosphotransferase family protein [Actinopolymorphaceae bacterium]
MQRLIEPFGIGKVTDIEPMPRSVRAHRLDTTRGRFVLSVFPPEVTRDHLAAMQDVRIALVANGLPAVAALVGRDGISAEAVDGRLVQVQPWVPHDSYADSWPRLVAAAGVLGAAHDVMAEREATPDQQGAPWSWPRTQTARLAAQAQDLVESGVRAGHDIAADVAAGQRILDTLAGHPCLAPGRPVQLTHGDFQGRNILVHKEVVRAVVDFEGLDLRPRLFDLAWPLVFWPFYVSGLGRWRDDDWSAAAACCR